MTAVHTHSSLHTLTFGALFHQYKLLERIGVGLAGPHRAELRVVFGKPGNHVYGVLGRALGRHDPRQPGHF